MREGHDPEGQGGATVDVGETDGAVGTVGEEESAVVDVSMASAAVSDVVNMELHEDEAGGELAPAMSQVSLVSEASGAGSEEDSREEDERLRRHPGGRPPIHEGHLRYCAVRGCPPGRSPAVTYHRIPAEGNPQRSIWLEACNIRNAEGRGRLNICSKHFEDEDFTNSTTTPQTLHPGADTSRRSARVSTTPTTTRRLLRPGAVPSRNLHADDWADIVMDSVDAGVGEQVHPSTQETDATTVTRSGQSQPTDPLDSSFAEEDDEELEVAIDYANLDKDGIIAEQAELIAKLKSKLRNKTVGACTIPSTVASSLKVLALANTILNFLPLRTSTGR